MPVLLYNKKARFDYQILETFQAGLQLSGKMVKLIRDKKVQLTGKYVVSQPTGLQIIDFGNEDLRQNIPLLLNKKEQAEIQTQLNQKGITCVVLNIKTVGRWLKADIALVKGKKLYHKKEDIKKRDLDRDMRRQHSI